ncbi:hypothetical protein IKG20_00385 [Candidatus Saccharibacteria bacterium]|nr:hypothetical protein [Candidatus Saccharibacteria bacterium]
MNPVQNPNNGKVRTKFRRLYYRIKHDYLSFDNIIFFVAIIACVIWTYSSLSATSRNWELSQKLNTREKEMYLLQYEVDTLELENDYYRSAEYQELAARSKQNKMLEGEHLVYLPANSEEAMSKYKTSSSEEEKTEEPSNVSQWMSFLFGV